MAKTKSFPRSLLVPQRRGRGGFTLIELQATLVILAVVVVAAGFFISGHIRTAKLTAAKITVASLNDALNQYKLFGGIARANSLQGDNSQAMNAKVLEALKSGFSDGGHFVKFLNADQSIDTRQITSSGQGQAFRFNINETTVLEGVDSETGNSSKEPQTAVTLTPSTKTIQVGSFVTFTASGGAGNGAYVWGGKASGDGTCKTLVFDELGTYTVSVYRSWDATHAASAVATATLTVVKANQPALNLNPSSATLEAGSSVTFSVSGAMGSGYYVWGGQASGSGSSKTLSFDTTGTYPVDVYFVSEDALYNNSESVTATVTVTKKNQATVAITPSQQSILVGASVTFTASGGSGDGEYVWGGKASGIGSSKTITFASAGTCEVTVYREGQTSYADSATASATVVVSKKAQSALTLSPSTKTTQVGQSVTFTVSGGSGDGEYVWGGAASGNGSTQSVTFDSNGTYEVTVYRASDDTYAVSEKVTATLTVENENQMAVVITPATDTVRIGSTLTFTASGGSGSGEYIWGGAADGSGTTQEVAFVATGTYTVTAYRAGDGSYKQSATTTATITVIQGEQATVSISPTTATVMAGESVTFTASGGSSNGVYTWGGAASGTGTTLTVPFASTGTYSVTVLRAGDDIYDDSNVATATVVVTQTSVTPTLTVNAPTSLYGTASAMTVTLSGITSGALDGRTVTLTLNGSSYTAAVVSGVANFSSPTSLEAGRYTVSASIASYAPATGQYTYLAAIGSTTLVVTQAEQETVVVSPTSAVGSPSTSTTFTASGGSGTGAYIWGGAVSATGSSVSVSFTSTGTRTLTVYRAADTNYTVSNTATATIYILNQTSVTPTVTVSAPSVAYTSASTITVTLSHITSRALDGQKVTLTLNGTTYTATVASNKAIFTSPTSLGAGSYTASASIAAYTPTSGNYKYAAASGSATLVVTQATITPVITISAPTTTYGTASTITATLSGITSGGLDGRTITFNLNGSNTTATLASNGATFRSPTNLAAGSYTVKVSIAAYTPSSGNYKYAAASGSSTYTVNGTAQSTIWIVASTTSTTVGTYVTVTAQGGSGNGEWYWGDAITGTGWSQTFVVGTSGTWTITVYRAASGNYAQSETATITLTVDKGAQPAVAIIPSTWYTRVGNSITFTASGGAGTGAYTWGGDASGTGTTKTITFTTSGVHTVTVYKAGDNNYNASSTVSQSISIGN